MASSGRVVVAAALVLGSCGGGDAPIVAATPATRDFGSVTVGTTSAVTTFTVANTGGTAAAVPVLAVGDPAFAVASSTCTAALAPGATCTVGVTFAPVAAHAVATTLTITAGDVSTAVALAGTGVATASLAIAPTTLDFGAVSLGATGAPAVFTVTNTGGAATGALVVAIAGVNASSFMLGADTCTGVALAPGATCTATVVFAPMTVFGAATAALTIAGMPGGTLSATLDGAGIATADLVVAPASADFGAVTPGSSSGNTTFTIANPSGTATAPLAVALGGTNPADFTKIADTCTGNAIAAGQTCAISVRFAPMAPGAKSASLTVAASAANATTAALTGTGVGGEGINITPSPYDFGSWLVGAASTLQTFTVTNAGGISTTVPLASVGGTDPGDFAIARTTCTTALAPGATCTVDVRFTPTMPGTRSANVSVSASTGGTATAGVSGLGLAPPVLAISPATHDFGVLSVGTNSAFFAFTVTNTGSVATGGLTSGLTGVNATQFVSSPGTCTGTLAPGATCTISARFAPSVNGNDTATLGVTATPGGTASATLTGLAASGPPITASPTSTDVGTVVLGSSSAPAIITVTNNGVIATGALTVVHSGSSAFAVTANTCTTLAPNATCTVAVTFTPTTTGLVTAAFLISGSPGGSVSIAVSGTGG